ncbi:glycosyltransferase family 4 protein [Rhizobium lusitanum]|uniref:Glycosyltransferase involved in cell wall biosynthesis n=1 Tax=Rhizobium lusitanum TaxID=293958 RepID=A0A7X0MCN1_9HYPH|nr:glycosyltransferase family 4 protein [Rhizobium lusitanum]MBB6485571.1 glycosyltransferase involved in cell wall biosynthesis [Rhizobium lusitanum]
MDTFDTDRYPGRPRILFVGFPESSHTHSWIDLLADASFNARLFALPSADPPADWPVKTYVTFTGGANQNRPDRKLVFPPADSTLMGLAVTARSALDRGILSARPRISRLVHGGVRLAEKIGGNGQPTTIEAALAAAIRDWQPDIIHTLGFDSASYLYLRARKQFGLEGLGRWVAQARGGPDLALQRYQPEYRELIEEVLRTCDHFIADNQPNYDYALTAGLTPEKMLEPGMGVVSGAGGMDIDALRSMWTLPPSQRERVILWPKAYETYTAKAMPVFEAIINVWEQIQPCRIEMIWMVQPDIKIWYEKMFPPHIKIHCPTAGRLTREETLKRIASARVMLAPSLSDGIPNTMMEAMALGAAPLVSPLDTIAPVVKNEENVLFARNLYPDEIGEALVRLMTDDQLVDRMASNNLVRVREMADRQQVKLRALSFYETIAEMSRIRRKTSEN